MMEQDWDDFGSIYIDDHVPKPCSVKEPNFFKDQKPLNYRNTNEFSANASKILKEYDRFLLTGCEVDSGCEVAGESLVDDDFNDVIFDVELEQREVEFDSDQVFDFEGKNDKMVDRNEVDVVGDLMEEDNDVLKLYAGIPESVDMVCKHNDDIGVNEQDSESTDETLNIILDHTCLNDDCEGSNRKDVVLIRSSSPMKNDYYPFDLDDLEPGDISGMKTKLGTDVEARVGHSDQSFHAVLSKGVRSVFTSQTTDADFKDEQNQVKPVHNAAYNYGVTEFRYLQNQVNPVSNAAYNYGATRFRHLPPSFRKAFNLEDDYSGYKPWTRPGVNISDFFNFDMDEESWQNNCKQMKQLLQTSPSSTDVCNRSESLKPIGEAIQVHISSGERLSKLEFLQQRERNSDAIIEIVCGDSADTKSFTKDLRDCALHEYKTRPTTMHKIIRGDKILPFPLDGSFNQIPHEERTSNLGVTMNCAQEGKQWTDNKSIVSKKKDQISNQEMSMHLDQPKERTEARKRLRIELVKGDKLNMGSSSQPADHQQGENDNKLNTGSAVGDQQEWNNDDNNNMLSKGSAVEEEFNRKQATEPIDNYEQDYPNNCNLANKLGNNVIFDNEKHDAKRGKNADEEYKMMQGPPKAGESCEDDMKQLMSNINDFMREIDELVGCHEHEHKICCLRWSA